MLLGVAAGAMLSIFSLSGSLYMSPAPPPIRSDRDINDPEVTAGPSSLDHRNVGEQTPENRPDDHSSLSAYEDCAEIVGVKFCFPNFPPIVAPAERLDKIIKNIGPSETEAKFTGIAQRIQDALKESIPGAVAEQHEPEMRVGEWKSASFALRPLGVPLPMGSGWKIPKPDGTGDETVAIYQSMTTYLDAPDFDIEPKEPQHYTVDFTKGATWHWNIRPRKEGELFLRYHLQGKPIIEGLSIQDTPIFSSQSWTVKVSVKPWSERFSDFVSDNWKLFAGGVGALIMAAFTAWVGAVFPKKSGS